MYGKVEFKYRYLYLGCKNTFWSLFDLMGEIERIEKRMTENAFLISEFKQIFN